MLHTTTLPCVATSQTRSRFVHSPSHRPDGMTSDRKQAVWRHEREPQRHFAWSTHATMMMMDGGTATWKGWNGPRSPPPPQGRGGCVPPRHPPRRAAPQATAPQAMCGHASLVPLTMAAPKGAPCWRPLKAAQHGGCDTADHGHERRLAARALPQAEAGA